MGGHVGQQARLGAGEDVAQVLVGLYRCADLPFRCDATLRNQLLELKYKMKYGICNYTIWHNATTILMARGHAKQSNHYVTRQKIGNAQRSMRQESNFKPLPVRRLRVAH